MPEQAQYSYDTFLSPFSWRYGSEAMRQLWSEVHKRRLWRQMWVALAGAEMAAGLVTEAQLADLRAHQDEIDVPAALTFESELQHDLMAEIKTYASQCRIGGGVIHLGATSMDIEDNADALRLRESMLLIEHTLRDLLKILADHIADYADRPCVAYTHLQPAEPTTIGYRLALYGQDLLSDLEDIRRVRRAIRGKGIKGAVGTSASYMQLLQDTPLTAVELESRIMTAIGLGAYPVSGQTYPRKQDMAITSVMASLASSLYKFALDLRLLQSPAIGEWAEPFGARQVGSSAMPFKRNPINSEKIDSLGRLVSAMSQVAWENASQSMLERTLDDSANRRELFPLIFLASDEMLIVAERLLKGLRIDKHAVERNLQRFGTFAATERVMMEAAKAGADRQYIHELLRNYSMTAWAAVNDGAPNPLIDDLCADNILTSYLPGDRIRALMDASHYVGDAPVRARAMAEHIRAALATPST